MIIPIVYGALLLGRAFDMKNAFSTPFNIFDPDDLEAKMQVIPRTFTQSHYRFLESSSDANDFLSINGELSLKIKNDNFKFKGAGEYLLNTVDREKTVELLITVYHETQTETFPSYTAQRTDWKGRPQSDVGTHYIRSITYGGQLIISYKLVATESEYMEDIKAAVNANLAISGSFGIEAKGNLEKLHKAVEKKSRTFITAYGTTGAISPPQSLEDLFDLVDKYPEMVKAINDGKGAPLKLEIVELSTLTPNYEGFLKNYAMDSMLNEATNKYDDLRVSLDTYRKWEDQGQIWPPEKEKLINAYQKKLKEANRAMSKAISDLDPTGGLNQFEEAFKIYGEDGENIPNRYGRDLQKLIHTVEEKPFYWYPYTKAVTHYIHWGSKNCTLPSPDPIYIGYAATSPKGFGSGGNVQCLPNVEPSLVEDKLNSDGVVSKINGLGFEYSETSKGQVFCAFCKLENATEAITIAGRTDCPADLKLEYSGYVTVNKDAGTASRFVCLDGNPDEEIPPTPTQADQYSGTLKPVWIKCANCDEDEKVQYVGCVVCSR